MGEGRDSRRGKGDLLSGNEFPSVYTLYSAVTIIFHSANSTPRLAFSFLHEKIKYQLILPGGALIGRSFQ